MAQLTITNLTSGDLLLQELYVTLGPGKSLVTDRYHDALHAMPRLAALWKAGQVSVTVTTPVSEGDFITQRVRHDGGLGDVNATQATHVTIATAGSFGPASVSPAVAIKDNLLYLVFAQPGDAGYRVFKIDRNYSDSLNMHIHWTKSMDQSEFNHTVKWRLDYKVFRSDPSGQDNGAGAGSFVETADLVYSVNDANTDRTIFRTPNMAIVGAVAGYYLAVKVTHLVPGGTPVTDPALLSLDMTYNAFVNIPI